MEALAHASHSFKRRRSGWRSIWLPCPDAWRQPSACPWEVRDGRASGPGGAVLCARLAAACRETWRGLQNSHRLPRPAAFIAQSAIACRERLGEALLPTFAPSTHNSPPCWPSSEVGIGRNSATMRVSPAAARPGSFRPERAGTGHPRLGHPPWLEPAFHLPESVMVLVQHTPRRLGRPHVLSFPPSRVPWPRALSLGAARSGGGYPRCHSGARALSASRRCLGGAGHLPRRGGNVCSAAYQRLLLRWLQPRAVWWLRAMGS